MAGMLSFTFTGDFSRTDRWLAKIRRGDFFNILQGYGQRGVEALVSATPSKTGLTAESWSYEVAASPGGASIRWINKHVDSEGTPIAIMLQYGHGTGTGGYVQGRDYINPALQPVFDEIANAVWREVTSD